MSKVYRYSEGEAEKSKDMMALLIEGLRAASYGRSKPTSLGVSSLDESRHFNRETGWDVVMEPGIAITRKAARKPVRHQHGLHELGFISESTVDSGDVGISTFLPDLKSLYTEDWDFYAKLQKQMISAMGLPASMVSAGPKLGGMGRYYSESIVDCKAPPYYSFEET